MKPMTRGFLQMALPGGGRETFGSRESREVHASLSVLSEKFFERCVLSGDVGFGEAYVAKEWDTEDVTSVVEWMILNVENHPTLMDDKEKASWLSLLKVFDNLRHAFRKNNLFGSAKNIAAHYDLGNNFFQLFLDPSMTYSSAFFASPELSLEEAQREKLDRLCRKIRLKPADHVLEIGCGWGSFAEHAVKKYGCRVTAITLSKAQHDYAAERFRKAGIQDRVELLIRDYRKVEGRYDKIVSIEMIEAVGHEFLDVYFDCCHKHLKKDGVLALQMILAPDHRYESFRKKSDWIQKYIFPGGLLPSLDAVHRAVRRTGDLGLLELEDMTPHYARTLKHWRLALNAEHEKLFRLGFDRAFLRKWNYYFSYCEAAFAMRNISVVQAVYSRPNNLNL